MTKKLKVGDKVIWCGSFGGDNPKVAIIEQIEINCSGKYGDDVKSVKWSKVDDSVVVTLDNESWAYGSQLKPLKK